MTRLTRHSLDARRAVLYAAPIVTLLILSFSGCNLNKAPKVMAAPPAPVTTAVAESRDVPLTISSVGNVMAYSTVSVKSMLTAPIVQAHFKQGDFVRKGQLLFALDPRTFEADLAKAKGQVARDVAAAENARQQARRYAALFKDGVVAREQNDAMQSSADQLDAAIDSDKAAVRAAEVNLEYTRINSPINGRAGDVLVYPGNLIKANDATMVILNQVSPIYVLFTIPEGMLADVRRSMAAGRLRVSAVFPDPSQPPVDGELNFVDNTVDTKTGTIGLKAEFANIDNRLWPGQYVNTVLTVGTLKDAVVIPSQAVQNGQKGPFVYIAKDDKTVEMRMVQLGPPSGAIQVIRDGIKAGETVVTDGQLRLVPGAKIEIKPAVGAPAGSTQQTAGH